MSSDQVQRFLRTEELYKGIIGLIPESVLRVVGETYVRGLLDAVLSQGKIEGRMPAYDDGSINWSPIHDGGLVEGWQRIVDSVD